MRAKRLVHASTGGLGLAGASITALIVGGTNIAHADTIPNATALTTPAADTSTDDPANTIIVTGTRRAERTVADSAVPVDVLSAKDLDSTPSPDLNDKLARVVPSFNVQRLPTFDGAAFVRPATLRGLSSDQTLVLIDNKRRHRSAYISTPQHGEQAADLSQIPEIALNRVEVLRDGASAQYGSDAIAGVINLLLEDRPGFAADVQAGQYYKGDGERYQAAARAGFALGDRGTVVLSGEYSSLGETDRGAAVNKIGQPQVRSWKFFGNAKYALTEGVELYAFGNINRTRSKNDFNYRDPTGSIYTRSYYQDNAPFLYPTYSLTSLYPNGFVPVFGADSQDSSLVAGLRGDASDTFHWDISGRYGRNRIRYNIWNTINASLGPESPTSFDAGTNVQTEYAANADFTYLLDIGLYHPVNVSFGGEWRRERYQIAVGDVAAYEVGPLSDLSPGSNGFPSPTPDQAGTFQRDSRAAYVDLDIDLTRRLNIGVAGRFENFDDFGSTWNYKVSARYKATPWLSVRGAISTGFHAPSVGQQHLTSTSQGPDPNNPPPAPQVIQTSGLIPSTNPIAEAVGGKPLVPEKARNYSAGLVLTPARGLNVSIDYYNIKIRDRLGLTSTLTLTDEQRATLVAQGISQAAQLTNFRFFINGYDTRTQGVDVVASYTTSLGGGSLTITGAYNYNKSKIISGDPKIVNANLVQEVEYRLPNHVGNLGADYQIGRFGISGRIRYYGPFTDALPYLPASLNQRISSESFFDLAISYNLTRWAKLTVGADNLFDNYPDKYTGPLKAYGIRYPTYRPYEADGGSYYARLSVKL